MGFNSMDDFINETSNNGQTWRADWNKNFLPTTAGAAGEWFSLIRGAGNPTADTVMNTGVTYSTVGVSFSTAGLAGVYTGGDVGTSATKHIVNVSAFSAAATSCPAVLMAIDVLGYVRCEKTTVTATISIATASLPRYGDGAGVQAFIYNNNAVAMGAATPTLQLRYTNSAGVTGRLTPTTLPTCKTAGANGLILYSGTGAGKYGPFMPLQTGDAGIRFIEAIQQSVSYVSGEYTIVLCRPLYTIPLTTIGVAGERDLMNQVPSLPRVYDGANIQFLLYNGVNTPTNTAYYGHIDFAWG